MCATLATTVAELPDEDAGGKLRAVTADDYASMQFRLVPREGSEATPSFDKARVVNVCTCLPRRHGGQAQSRRADSGN